MPSLFAADALLPSGWARDVLLEWDDAGMLTRVESGALAQGPRAAGAVLAGMTNVHSPAFQRAMAGPAETRGHTTDDFWTSREEMYSPLRPGHPHEGEATSPQLYNDRLKQRY